MTRSICIIDGHPDPDPDHLIHALCDAYAEGAEATNHKVSRIRVADLNVPFLTSQAEFNDPPPEPILSQREKIAEADHLFIAFPLWLGGMPARLKAFFEQAARAEFFLKTRERGVLGLSGFKPMHHTIIGSVDELTPSKVESWFTFMKEIGGEAV